MTRAELADELAYAIGLEPERPCSWWAAGSAHAATWRCSRAFEIVFADELGA